PLPCPPTFPILTPIPLLRRPRRGGAPQPSPLRRYAMKRLIATSAVGLGILAAAPSAMAQNFPTDDPVLRQIWREGTENSHVYTLAQTLTDSIGPRLTGSPGINNAHNWAVSMYKKWGIEARNEQYGTWTGWRRGVTHIDL